MHGWLAFASSTLRSNAVPSFINLFLNVSIFRITLCEAGENFKF